MYQGTNAPRATIPGYFIAVVVSVSLMLDLQVSHDSNAAKSRLASQSVHGRDIASVSMNPWEQRNVPRMPREHQAVDLRKLAIGALATPIPARHMHTRDTSDPMIDADADAVSMNREGWLQTDPPGHPLAERQTPTEGE